MNKAWKIIDEQDLKALSDRVAESHPAEVMQALRMGAIISEKEQSVLRKWQLKTDEMRYGPKD